MGKRTQTLKFHNKPYIISAYAIGGKKEGEGPLRDWFDECLEDDTYGENTWEKSESKMLKTAMMESMRRAGKTTEDIGAMLSGDLLNQLMSSSFMARDLQIPFLGMYGACSTMTESLMLGAVLTDGGYSDNVMVGASSHYCTAERQFRMPLEHGNQRPPSAQWTATAAGAMLLSRGIRGGIPDESNLDGSGGQKRDLNVTAGIEDRDRTARNEISEVKTAMAETFGSELRIDAAGKVYPQRQIRIESGTIGKVIDAGVKDSNQMGSAMAPAAVDTILTHLGETGRTLDYYDLVCTGDLGFIGKSIVRDLLEDAGVSRRMIADVYDDCGAMIFAPEQDVHSGGSGCGCSASIFSGYVYRNMKAGNLKRTLIISTGALLSTISPLQGESIPGIAHAISLEAVDETEAPAGKSKERK